MKRSEFGRTRAAAIVFAIHTVLLFLPPVPPLFKGSLWSYLLSYVAVVLLALDARSSGPSVVGAWSDLSPGRRTAIGVAAVAALAAFGAVVHQTAPELFERYSREEGIWEPISLAIFVNSAMLLFALSRSVSGDDARHVKLVAWAFALLALEEIDYFGIFGGLIGRIEGIYAGSLHDIIRLAEAGLVSTGVAVGGAAIAVAVAVLLLRAGYLQPRRILEIITSPAGAWLVGAVLFLALGAAEEASLFGVDFPPPTPEELIETLGALCIGVFALELARDAFSRSADRSAAGPADREYGPTGDGP